MRVMFYAPQHTGHHFAFLARMLPGFIGLPVEIVVATTPQALESAEYERTLAPLAGPLRFVTCCTTVPRQALRGARHRLRELVRAIEIVEPDHVAVCYADGLWEQALVRTMLGRRPWPRELVVEGWLYRGRFADPDDRRLRSRVRRWLFVRLLESGLFRRLHIDHELLYEFGAKVARTSVRERSEAVDARTEVRATPGATELVLTPNPIVIYPEMTKADARRELGIDAEGQWVSLSGVIARFKGAHLLLEAFRVYREKLGPAGARLLLAGPHDPDVRELLSQPPYREWLAEGAIVSIDRYLNEREMYLSAAAADVVTAPYPHHQGRSSIILWAAAAGRPSLGTAASVVGHVSRKERLGETCDVSDSEALARSMRKMLQSPWTAEDAQRVRRYAEFHRVENYQRLASELVRRRCGEAKPQAIH